MPQTSRTLPRATSFEKKQSSENSAKHSSGTSTPPKSATLGVYVTISVFVAAFHSLPPPIQLLRELRRLRLRRMRQDAHYDADPLHPPVLHRRRVPIVMISTRGVVHPPQAVLRVIRRPAPHAHLGRRLAVHVCGGVVPLRLPVVRGSASLWIGNTVMFVAIFDVDDDEQSVERLLCSAPTKTASRR